MTTSSETGEAGGSYEGPREEETGVVSPSSLQTFSSQQQPSLSNEGPSHKLVYSGMWNGAFFSYFSISVCEVECLVNFLVYTANEGVLIM